jgi:hypothetical protein
MAIHVVILKPPYLRAVLRGEKTIECRLSKTAVPPFGQVTAGERLFLKYSGGPFAATALAHRVEAYDQLTPADVKKLRERYNAAVRGDGDYWHAKRDSRFATFVHLRAVEPLDLGPAYTKSPYRGWFVLGEDRSPLWELPLTAGALRNRYLRLSGATDRIREHRLTLELPDGHTVSTHITHGAMLHWRGWGPYYKAYNLTPGDRVRLLAVGPQRYRVSFHCQHHGAHD